MLALLIVPLVIGIASARPNLHARDDVRSGNDSLACFFMTSDVNWQGEGINLCQWGGVCAGALPDGLSAKVSSAGPTEGQTCFLYTAENCGGKASDAISYPGYADLSAIGFMNKAKSWRCYKWSDYTPLSSSSSSAGIISTTTTFVTETASMARPSAVRANANDVSITTTKSGVQPTASPVDTTTVTTTTIVNISTTMTAGPWTNGSTAALFGTGNVGTINMTHTYGGRGGTWTTLTTYVAGPGR